MATARSYRKGLMISVGPLINSTVDLHTVMSKPKTGLNRLCPMHHEKLKLENVCPVDDEPIAWGAWKMGRETADGWIIVDEADRPSEPRSESIEFIPVPKGEFNDSAIYGSGFYYAEPSSEASKASWTILSHMAEEYALVGRGNFRAGTPKLWSLELFRGVLVLREVTFPEYIKDEPEIEPVEVDSNIINMAMTYASSVTQAWDDIDKDSGADRFEKWVEEQGERIVTKESQEPSGTAEDYLSDLEAALKRAVNS